MDTVTKSVVARGWEKGGVNRQNTEFWDSENIGYDKGRYMSCGFVQNYRMYHTKCEPWYKMWTLSDHFVSI